MAPFEVVYTSVLSDGTIWGIAFRDVVKPSQSTILNYSHYDTIRNSDRQFRSM